MIATATAPPQIRLGDGHLPSLIDRGVDALFRAAASDITLQSDDYIFAYINRRWVSVSNRRLEDGEAQMLVRHLYGNDGATGMLGSGKPLDFDADLRPYTDPAREPYDLDYSVRCRVNITRCRVGTVSDAASITIRTIPSIPPRLEALKLPAEIVATIFPSQGLVLVVGITGSGKSTLLASCNRHRLEQPTPVKILTIEDPIEYVYPRLPIANAEGVIPSGRVVARMPEVSQVQLDRHLRDFSLAAPNVLRRKGDVIVMGEMRDKESVDTGLLLAQTGHCTYGTLHCETPAQAVQRVVSEYPYEAQPAVANKLLDNLRLIVAQKIERDTKGKGRAFRSWCVFDQAFKTFLARHPHQEWNALIQERMESKGHTFAQQSLPALRAGEVSFNAFLSLAGFNPIEGREYVLGHAPELAEVVTRELELQVEAASGS
jgi:defect-in-organelle-trafficking protein DotB